jgi:hypothetical protein
MTSSEEWQVISFALGLCETEYGASRYLFGKAVEVGLYLLKVKPDGAEGLDDVTVLEAYDKVVEDEEYTKYIVASENSQEIKSLWEDATSAFEDYAAYANSARGALSGLDGKLDSAIRRVVAGLAEGVEEDGVKQVLDIAKKWGMSPATKQD